MWRPAAASVTTLRRTSARHLAIARFSGGPTRASPIRWCTGRRTSPLTVLPSVSRRPPQQPLALSVQRRGAAVIGPALPPAAAEVAAATNYPAGSPAQVLLERCLEAAVARGTDVTAPYVPWAPVDLMQTLLVDVHAASGCSWLTAIMLAVVGIRVVTLPISVAAIRGAREKALIQPQFQELMDRQKNLTMEGDQEKIAKVTKEVQAFTQKHGRFFMLKGVWNLICFQMPLYITAFASMRGFANHPDIFRGFAMEAPLWLDSLALPDPYALFPMLTAAIMLTNTELFGSIDTEVAQAQPELTQQSSTQVEGQSTFQKYQKWIMRGSAVFFVPMTWNFPAGVFVFMSTNLVVATLQNRLLRLPVLERLLEIPPTAERVAAATAAAAKANASQRPALIPLRGALPKLQDLRAGVVDSSSRSSKGSTFWSPALELAASSGAQVPPLAAALPRSLADLSVSPRYAVRRARSEAD